MVELNSGSNQLLGSFAAGLRVEQRPAARQPPAATILMTMLQPQPQLQQVPSITWRMLNGSQTQRTAAVAMASQWPLDRCPMQIQRRQQKASRGTLVTQHSLQLQVCIRIGLCVLMHALWCSQLGQA